MLKRSVTLLDKGSIKYSLVILEAKRAHELEAGAPATQEFKSVKSTLRAGRIESGSNRHPDPEGRKLIRRRVEEERLRKEEEERKIKEQIAEKGRR